MATQQIEFFAPSGLTLAVTLHVEGSDAIAYTASAVAEQTNRRGVYRATFSGISAGTYQLIARSGAIAVCSYWGFAEDTASTFTFGDLVGLSKDRSGVFLANGAITAASFAANSITAAAIATDAVSEITTSIFASPNWLSLAQTVDEIANASNQVGSGANQKTITITDGASPLDGVEVWVSTDSGGSNVVAGSLVTNAFGQATFMLDSGTYYVWSQLAGYNFNNPTQITVP